MPADEDDRQDLRLAVVMTGGVSLAVWMGGVAHEINRVVRRDHPVYAALLDLTHSTVRVDVISGTSAGGLNGAMLATAQARGADIASLREVWLQTGALDSLLRPATESDPPSLLKGGYFLDEIQKALRALQGTPTSLDDAPVHLVVTGTLLNGRHRGTPDDFGSVVRDVEHRAQFTFRRSALHGDDFADADAMGCIGRAARSSASFPLAFEPVRMRIGSGSAGEPDMARYADFPDDRWVVDGGVLVNKPLAPALEAIFAQSADRQVRRVLAYVVPDPGESALDDAEPADMPTLAEVGLASFLRIPRNQSVQDLLDTLGRHNRRVAAQRRRRELTAALDLDDGTDLGALTRVLYPQYRKVRADRMAHLVLQLIAHGVAEEDAPEGTGPTPTVMPSRRRLRDALLAHLRNLPPAEFPGRGAAMEDWFTTADTVERAGVVVLDLLRRGMGLAAPEAESLRADLREARRAVHDHLATARRLRPTLTVEGRDRLADMLLDAARERDAASWAPYAVERFFGRPDELEGAIRGIAGLLEHAVGLCLAAYESAPEGLQKYYEGTEELARGLRVTPARGESADDAALRRLLEVEIVQVALGEEPVTEQTVQLIQLSADVPNGFDGRDRPPEKLAGLQLAHFGAFYKRSWRANDWLWGRMDAAQRMALVLVDPFRLFQLQWSYETVVAQITELALPAGDPDLRAVLERYGSSAEAIARELSFLERRGEQPPEKLPVCASMIARRLQLEILQEEMPRLLEEVAADARDDRRDAPAPTIPAARVLPPAEAVERFCASHVGEERIISDRELRTDRFARTSTHGGAVFTAAVGGNRSGLGRIPFAAPLRAAGLALYAVTDAAVAGTRVGAAAVVAAAVAGAGLIGVALFVRLPSALLLLGLALLFATLTAAFLRRRQWWAIGGLLVGVILAVAPRTVTSIFGWGDSGVVDVLRPYEAAWVVVALALGAVAAASVTASSPRKRSP